MPFKANLRAFTLIELVAVIVVLAILSGVAIPKYLDYSSRAKISADTASIAGINTALNSAFLQHRLDSTASSGWVSAITQVAAQMETDALPSGIIIDSGQLVDQRGNRYNFTAETAAEPALVVLVVSGGGS